MIRERVMKAWAEMIANCSSGTGTVPTTYGKRPSRFEIRDVSLEESLENSPTDGYPMPYEAHLSDAELVEYKKGKQQQLLTNNSQQSEECQSSIQPDTHCADLLR